MQWQQKEEQIRKYLDKNYQVKDWRFFYKILGINEWGGYIVNSLVNIFSFDKETCRVAFKSWAYTNGLTDETYERAYEGKVLKTTWSSEMIQDLEARYSIKRADEHVARLIVNKIANELSSQFLKYTVSNLTSTNDLFGVVKCEGYELNDTEFNAFNLTPMKLFVSMAHIEVLNERKNNPFWQDWIRTRKQD